MAIGNLISRAKALTRLASIATGASFAGAYLTHFGVVLSSATDLFLPKPRDWVQEHQALHFWQERIATHLTPLLPGDRAEQLLQEWGFTTYYYDRDELNEFVAGNLIEDLPVEAGGALIAGRSIGELGFGQPHLRIVVFLRLGDTVHSVRPQVLHAG